ncbi:MAG: GILT family protein [archaeon]
MPKVRDDEELTHGDSVEKHSTKSASKHSPRSKSIPMMWVALCVLLLAVLGVSVATKGFSTPLPNLFAANPAGNTGTNTDGKYGTSKVEFYVMSQCPYGTQVEDGIAPVLKKLGGSVDFSLNFIANDNGDGTFKSLHGENEVKGDIVQLCAAKYNPDKYMDMVICMNKDAKSIPGNWEKCSADNGLDSAKIKACYEGEEGKTLLSESIKKSNAVKATGSPTMYFEGQLYSGGRDTTSFTKAICAKLSGHPECVGIPACSADSDCTAEATKEGKCEKPGQKDAKCTYVDPVKVEVKYLVDNRCTDCNPERVNTVTKNLFKGAEFTEVKWDSKEGQELMKKYEIQYLPAFVFDSNVVKTTAWTSNSKLQTSFVSNDDGTYSLLPAAVGATWDPTAEICNNKKDDNDDGKIDCDDSTCKDTTMCLTFEKPTLDFFVMSYCPYGNQAEVAIEPVYQVLKDDALFKPHYIYYENYGGGGASFCIDSGNKYCSMHGVQEANQNVREQCVEAKYGMDGWFKFTLEMNTKCSSKNADTCFESVAKGLSYDTAYIKSCEESNAEKYAAEDARLMTVFGAQGSPAMYINGAEYSEARTAAGIQAALCALFDKKPEGCSADLGSADTATASAPAAGGCGV